ncbi:MAG TPA: methyl-accepting chemotaxis protein [Clostridia bacterium]|nr:methyl-accepting chemotaxis protein [Clostridia bacterium]
MIKLSDLNSCKALAEVLVGLIPGGVLFGLVEGDTATWIIKSETFSIKMLETGEKLDPDSATMKAIHEGKVIHQNIPRTVYGKRLALTAIPVVNDAGEVKGALAIALPKLHPIATAFTDFAPILAEMFQEGAILYITDLEKVFHRHASKKFDLPQLAAMGYELEENDIAYKVIKSKKPMLVEIGPEKYGIPVFIANYPLLDADDTNEVVGSFGIVTPKEVASKLRAISGNLENGLAGISAAIQQLAASAATIHNNEQELNNNIIEITGYSEEISAVSMFIKDIADETKMLGLNAAIEAARAGEAGRGFGVVAEEIRKLSDQSKSTVPQINKLTNSIKTKVDGASEKSKGSLNSSQEQAAATEEITASIEEISAMSEELNRIAKDL